MDLKELQGLYESYKSVYDNSEELQENRNHDDTYDLVLEYLVSEGFADTEENAQVIMSNMSEAWFKSIVEETKG